MLYQCCDSASTVLRTRIMHVEVGYNIITSDQSASTSPSTPLRLGQSVSMGPKPNVILFGASGSGKSSIINMLVGSQVAQVSSGAAGCTFASKSYEADILGQKCNIWDTAGLEEAEKGTVPNTNAIVALYNLLRKLENGVNLLIFCMRAPRISESAPKNWVLFNDIICNKKVPIVIVVTALELQSEEQGGMDSWWYKNKGHFDKFKIFPRGQACITTIRGKKLKNGSYAYEEEYDESKEKVKKLIRSSALTAPWKVPRTEWWQTITHTWQEWNGWRCRTEERSEKRTVTPLIDQLVRECGMTRGEAETLAKALNH
ncbi:hypothetical protein AX16_001116 [Volvariella volvacea WC 439]|nr:hypothetical protein AX16_001116 [Volvariella volvacea WC 439]